MKSKSEKLEKSLIKPVMLRRLKSQVDLVVSEKQEHVLFINMTKRQSAVYNKYLKSDSVKRVLTGDSAVSAFWANSANLYSSIVCWQGYFWT